MIPTSPARVVFGQTFQNPILLASGTAGFGRELDGILDLDLLGGLVTKAVSLAPRHGNAPPRVAEFSGGMLNSVGLANPGLAEVRRIQLPWLAGRLRQARLLVNVVGFEEPEYAEVIAGLEDQPGITAYELNLSCPNTKAGGVEFGVDPRAVERVIAACRRETRRPLIAKLSPVLPDIAAMAAVAVDAGADGITAVNTLPGYLRSEQEGMRAPRLGNGNGGVSGPALLPIGVLAVRRIHERLPKLPIIGAGGVRNTSDARQYLEAGAALVAIGTAQLAAPRLPLRIIAELKASHG